MKTARAIAVLVRGPATGPAVVSRQELALWDPKVPESRQPYHAALDLPEREGSRVVARATRAVRKVTERTVRELAEKIAADGYALRGIGLVIGSDADPERIGNPHVRAHASEGRLFWQVLEDAAEELELPSLTLLERELHTQAGFALKLSDAQLRAAAKELGRPMGRPWRADEKAAAIAAWMALR